MSLDSVLELLFSLKANNGGNAERNHSAWSSGGQSSRPVFNGRKEEYQNSAEDLGQILQFEKGAPLVNIALGVMGYQVPEVSPSTLAIVSCILSGSRQCDGFSSYLCECTVKLIKRASRHSGCISLD